MNMKAKLTNGPRLVLVSPGYNVENELKFFFHTLLIQNYQNWICIAIDDISTDGTYSKLISYAEQDHRIFAVRNIKKKYQLKNWFDIIHNNMEDCIIYHKDGLSPLVEEDDIIVFMDLDDWFGKNYVFEMVVKEYLFRDILCTTARNFQLSDLYDHDASIFTSRDQLLEANTHQFSLFTYLAKLFLGIPENHFKDEQGNWYQVCGDMAITMPILYQAGPEHHHHHFIDNFIIYNNIRPECDDNKMVGEVTAHELTWPMLTKSFRNMVKDNLLTIY